MGYNEDRRVSRVIAGPDRNCIGTGGKSGLQSSRASQESATKGNAPGNARGPRFGAGESAPQGMRLRKVPQKINRR